MSIFRSYYTLTLLILLSAVVIILSSYRPPVRGFVPTTLNDFFLAGSQPLESGTISNPGVCDNCHGNYDQNAEPFFNWQGSMMAQAARDPLYLACLAIANQDAPESGDLCIRCHAPKGWLEGRSVPTDGSALTDEDREGVQCHFCHKMVKPSGIGINPYPGDTLYTIDPPASIPSTYTLDQTYLTLVSNIPPASANGMYLVSDQDNRRGPYFDPPANHSAPYSPLHRDAALCGTCHDVSNPVYDTQRDSLGNITGYAPNTFDSTAPSHNTYDLFPIERTYSEWLMSDYNSPSGISGTYFGGNKSSVSTCQDCHMRDVTGKGCNKNVPVRNDLPLHDMTGGNTFIPKLIDLLFPGETDTAALSAGVARARDMLQHAASMSLTVDSVLGDFSVTVTNETGHKLPSGYPEGRRIWLHARAVNSLGDTVFESGAYDTATAVLNTTGAKIYQIKPGLSPSAAALFSLPPGPSFHFVLNDTIYSDNRIPPRGFTNAAFDSIQSPVIAYSYPDGQYWDVTNYSPGFLPDRVEVALYYQTVSKEYVEFLRDENTTNSAGQDFYNLWSQNGKSAPELMNYEIWSKLTIWNGAESAAWNDSANWDYGVPNGLMNVVVTADPLFQPVVSSDVECNNLVVEPGAEVNITGGATLTVFGDLQIRGTIDSTASASPKGKVRVIR